MNPNKLNNRIILSVNPATLETVGEVTFSYGIKSFRTGRLDFWLNEELYPVRAGTVIWH